MSAVPIEKIRREVQAACADPRRVAAPAIRALDLLQIRKGTAAAAIGVSPVAFSAWATGRKPVPPELAAQLITLAHEAHRRAVETIGAVAVRPDATSPELEAWGAYLTRVREAGEILAKLNEAPSGGA